MPMKKGASKRTINTNIKEFHAGKTYAKTKAKFGKKTADRQAVAAAMNTARKSAGGSRNQGTKRRKPLKARAK